jgi:hypothetical protein
MKTHDTFLELAAIAIDFPLSGADHGRLEQHLADCHACGRTAAALRADTLALSSLPAVTLPERRGAEILAAALHPGMVRHPARLLVVIALLGLLLVGSLAVGAQLFRHSDTEDLSVVPPVPTMTHAPDAATPSPGATPDLLEPHGTLVVTEGDGTTTWIELVAMDGKVTRLAEGRDPAWLSADTIVYTCWAQAGGVLDVCAVDIAGPAKPRTLLAGADRPAPAPDGRTIAVHRGMIDVGETWLMAADGSNPRLLHSGAFSRWSPDGAWLAGQPESAGYEVAIVGADGLGYKVLGSGYDPAWSPTGNRIAYALIDGQGVATVRSVDVASSQSEVLVTAPAGGELAGPAWLADGRLLFVQDGNVWLFDPAGGSPVQVTTGAAIVGGSATDEPEVSRDGAWIAYTDGSGTGTRVAITSIDGSRGATFPWSGPTSQPRWAPAPVPATGEPGKTPVPLGAVWAPAAMPVVVSRPIGTVEAVIAGGPGFIAVGRGCVGDEPTCEAVVWTSIDGTSWQRVPASDALQTDVYNPTSGPVIGMFDITIGGSGFVAIGYAARPTMQATTWFSPNGITWERDPLGAAGTTRLNAVAWDGQQYIAVGEDRSGLDGTLASIRTATARAAVWTSPDGRTWTRVPHTPVFDVGGYIDTMEDPDGGGMSDIVAGPGGMVAVGSECTSAGACQPAAWTTGGTGAWMRVADLPASSGRLRSVAASGSGYVAVGAGPSAILYSADGQSWHAVQSPPSTDLQSVTRIGDRFVAAAATGPETVWGSPDGQAWAPLDAQGGPVTASDTVVTDWRLAADNATAVWFGRDGGGDPVAWVSVAGTAP